MPDYFADLVLDDVIRAVTSRRESYALESFFFEPLLDVDAIGYRHDVFRDLEAPPVLAAVASFAKQMQSVRREIAHADKADYAFDRQRWTLRAAQTFGTAIQGLDHAMDGQDLRSVGLASLRDYLAAYARSELFTRLINDTLEAKSVLTGVRYALRVRGLKVTVSRYRPGPDYGTEVLADFDKFRQGDGKKYDWRFDDRSDLNHVEAAILDRVARLSPEPFEALRAYAEAHAAFLDPKIDRFDREVQFYLAYLEYIEPLRRAGLRFCYPEVTAGPKAIDGLAMFDLALAASLVAEGKPVVPNDLELRQSERIFVVSGPNQGGKTTFARAIGQIHHLARIGVPVPGERMKLPLVDRIFTHFERQERVEDLNSKLEDDLRRIHQILEVATSESLLVMNESFSSTTVDDQLFIGRRIVARLLELGLLAVIVTFLDELSTLDAAIVSLVSGIDPDDPTRRTFKIERRAADGLAYAIAIAERHHVTYPSLKARLAR